MRSIRSIIPMVVMTACTYSGFAQQVYDADNGITASGSSTTRKVSLGGTLTGTTGINLSNYNLNFTGTGSLGIRTASPAAPLHVYKSASANYNPVMILEDGLLDGYVMFQMKGTNRKYHLGVGNQNESAFGLANKFFIWDQDAVAARMVVDINGNVGIGTNAPAARLSLAGPSAGTSGLLFTQLNNTSTAVTGNGKVLGLDASGNVILVNDIGGAGTTWPLSGAAGTNPATNFLGTTDNQDLVFRTNNQERVRMKGNGNLLVGTTTDNGFKMNVLGTINSTGLRLEAGNDLYWQDPNTHIRRGATDNTLELQEYTGLFRFTGLQNLNIELKHPSYGSAYFGFPADKNFVLTHHSTPILASNDVYGSTAIKLGAPLPQYADDKGVALYLFGGLGGNASSGFDGGNVYIDGGVRGSASKNHGNILIGTQQGNVGIGTATPGNRLSIAGATAGTSGLQFTQLNSASTAVTGNGKVLGLDATGNVILVNDAGGGAGGWGLTGNAASVPGTNFIGTTDNQDLVFKTNNAERMRIATNGLTTVGPFVFDPALSRPNDRIRIGKHINTTDGQNNLISTSSDGGLTYHSIMVERDGDIGIGGPGGASFNVGNPTLRINAAGVLGIASQYWMYGQIGGPINSSALMFSVSNTNEWINTASYPNGANTYTIATILQAPTGSNKRAPLQLGGRELRLMTGSLNNAEVARMTETGNMLIGTTTENGSKLQVNGTVWASALQLPTGASAGKVLTSDASGNATWQTATGGGSAGWGLTGNASPGASSFIGTTDANPVVFKANNIESFRIAANGNIGIGIGTAAINNTDYKLYVLGNIRTRKVRVDADTWADYVFEKNYNLLPLSEVEKYIAQHRHLPEVPSAAEVAQAGVDLGDNQVLLLKKIEELTLYAIEQNKMLKQQQEMMKQQQEMMKQQQERIEALEKKATEKDKK